MYLKRAIEWSIPYSVALILSAAKLASLFWNARELTPPLLYLTKYRLTLNTTTG
jgi:Na+-translocating ferredoxin:NAD+ oxidoreductase RnfD subunit